MSQHPRPAALANKAMVERAVMARSTHVPAGLRERFEADEVELVERAVSEPSAATARIEAFHRGLPDFDALARDLGTVFEDFIRAGADDASLGGIAWAIEMADAMKQARMAAAVHAGFGILAPDVRDRFIETGAMLTTILADARAYVSRQKAT